MSTPLYPEPGFSASSMPESATLRVAEAFQQDIGLGTARLDVGTRQRLKVGVGDIVEIRGRKITAAVVNRAQPDDEGKGIIRVEAVVRRNAGVSIGDRVLVQRVDCPIAESITIAPSAMTNGELARVASLASRPCISACTAATSPPPWS